MSEGCAVVFGAAGAVLSSPAPSLRALPCSPALPLPTQHANSALYATTGPHSTGPPFYHDF